MQSAVLAIVNPSVRPSVRLSVCLSVCPSVTRWHCVNKTHATITGSSREDRPMTLVSLTVNLTSAQNSKGNIVSEGPAWERGMENRQFLANKSIDVSQKRCKIGWVYLYSNLCSGLQKAECVLAVQEHSRSSKVWFWYQSKARMRLLISPSLWLDARQGVQDRTVVIGYGPILCTFLRYGDLLAKNCPFSYPSLIRRPRSPCCLWNFAAKLTVRKLVSRGYPPVKTAWT